jgi:uncharacterized cofD-like protein
LIILGPGSLYTSIIPNLLVDGIAQAIRASKARKLYVCNLVTQLGETINYSAADHVDALLAHAEIPQLLASKLIQAVLVNDQQIVQKSESPIAPVAFDPERMRVLGIAILKKSLADQSFPGHHDSNKLAKEIMTWFVEQKTKRQLPEQKKSNGLYQRVASFFSI